MSFDTPPMFNCPKCKRDISKPNRCHHCGWFDEPEPQTPESSGNFTNDNNGIAEQIRQQEQTNKHLQQLISDFFWFRIAIAGILLVGFIFGSGVFK